MKIKECILIEAFKCHEDESVVDVAKKLRQITLRHIFVTDKNNHPTGIISVIDINNRVVAEAKDATKLKAKDIMSKPIDVVDINDNLEDFYEKLIKKNHVMAPVTENKKMVGIITLHQILKNLNKQL